MEKEPGVKPPVDKLVTVTPVMMDQMRRTLWWSHVLFTPTGLNQLFPGLKAHKAKEKK